MVVMTQHIRTDCLIVGAGPAGLMLGLLLARSGIPTVLVEKHPDFLRDFRGDTIHPSTQDVLAQLGLLDEFLRLPHSDLSRVTVKWGETELTLADFTRLPALRQILSFMPQSDFLGLLANAAEKEPDFTLLRTTRFDDLIFDSGTVVGAHATALSTEGESEENLEVRCELVVAADGRDSTARARSGLPLRSLAADMDVLWFRLDRLPEEAYPFMQAGAGMTICIDRTDYFQVAHVIPAGSWHGTACDLERVTRNVARVSKPLATRMSGLSPNDLRLLRVRLTRMPRWSRPGLLCIGDAAHAMSPAGGVGVNLALQDAVATANRIVNPLLHHSLTLHDLRAVQRRRTPPVVLIQQIQRVIQKPLIATDARLPWVLRAVRRIPALAHVTGRVVGVGLRPERIRTGVARVP